MEEDQSAGWPWKKLLLIGGGAVLLSGGVYLSFRWLRNYLKSSFAQDLLRMFALHILFDTRLTPPQEMATQYENNEQFSEALGCMLEFLRVLDELGVQEVHPMRYVASFQIYTWACRTFRFDLAKDHAQR